MFRGTTTAPRHQGCRRRSPRTRQGRPLPLPRCRGRGVRGRPFRPGLALPARAQELPEAGTRGRPAELPQHQDNLPAVMRRVIHRVLDEVAENVRVPVDRKRRLEPFIGQRAEEHTPFLLKHRPGLRDRRKIRKLFRREPRAERAFPPPAKPRALPPQEVPEGPPDRAKAGTEIPVELTGREPPHRLQEPPVGPAVVPRECPSPLDVHLRFPPPCCLQHRADAPGFRVCVEFKPFPPPCVARRRGPPCVSPSPP
jgi:hypothetical protein